VKVQDSGKSTNSFLGIHMIADALRGLNLFSLLLPVSDRCDAGQERRFRSNSRPGHRAARRVRTAQTGTPTGCAAGSPWHRSEAVQNARDCLLPGRVAAQRKSVSVVRYKGIDRHSERGTARRPVATFAKHRYRRITARTSSEFPKARSNSGQPGYHACVVRSGEYAAATISRKTRESAVRLTPEGAFLCKPTR
jgi:hypothetical protein